MALVPGRRSKKPKAPDVHDIWREAARRIGGRYEQDGRKPVIRKQFGPWEIIQDKHVVSNGQSAVVYTRTRAHFLAQDDFRCVLERRRWYSRFRLFGARRLVQLGNRTLDERFVVRSRHTARARSLFHNRELHELLERQPSLRMEVRSLSWWQRRRRGSRVRLLSVRTTGVVTDVERLVNFFGLLEETLETLVRIGSAVREPVRNQGHHGDLRRSL